MGCWMENKNRGRISQEIGLASLPFYRRSRHTKMSPMIILMFDLCHRIPVTTGSKLKYGYSGLIHSSELFQVWYLIGLGGDQKIDCGGNCS